MIVARLYSLLFRLRHTHPLNIKVAVVSSFILAMGERERKKPLTFLKNSGSIKRRRPCGATPWTAIYNGLDVKADIAVTGELEETSRTGVLNTVDEFCGIQFKQVNGHLTGNQLDFGFLAEFT